MVTEKPSKQLHESAQRVQDYLHQKGLDLTTLTNGEWVELAQE